MLGMDVPSAEATGRAGVALADLFISHRFGWLFRRQLEGDVGIDAHVEPVVDGKATGSLLGLQIKTGESYLSERKVDGYVYRPADKHVQYWLAHGLPYLEKQNAWWEHVTRDTLTSTGKGWKILLPINQELDPKWIGRLHEIAAGDPYILRLRQLQLAARWMKLLARGGEISLEVDEWVNKTSGRAELVLHASDPVEQDASERHWPHLIFPYADYAIELPRLFPWADLSIDEDYYYDYDFARYELECGIWDREDGRYFYGTDFDDWRATRQLPTLRPYENDGEVASWRLLLRLSDVGRAFLALDQHFEEGLPALRTRDEIE